MQTHLVIRNMNKYLFIFLIFFSCLSSTAQISQTDQNLRKEFFKQKAIHYQQLRLSEMQMTANQEDYDVKYYALDLTPDPTISILSGQVQVVAEVIALTLDHVELNFWEGMIITDIHITNLPDSQLTYTHNDDILSIDLNSTYTQGEQFSLIVEYYGRPQLSNYHSFGFLAYNDNPMIGTLSEPFGARAWWPCKDVPSDKADSVDIRVTVPNDLIVASNGTLRETIKKGDKTTYWWHEQYPIVTYLVSLAIHPYTVYYDDYLYNNDADTMKIHFYVFPDNYEYYSPINAKVKDMISFYSKIFGEYPFVEEKYGHADYLIGGAMEHQTCSSFAFWTEWVYAHELAHQWWGDLITCNSFHHIWLNEGFATYSEALWYEYAYPEFETASQYQMNFNRYLGPGTIYLEDPETDPIFHGGLSYSKASWVLHMLRHITGDNIFFDILHTYYASPSHQYATATTEEFQLVCEQVSGLDLQKFFHQWIYNEYYPVYSYGWTARSSSNGYQIDLTIDQVQQNTGLFWMPIDVQVTTNNYDTVFVVWDSLQSQTFRFFADEEPVNLELDPNNWILKETQEKILTPHAKNVIAHVNYKAPGLDTLILTAGTENPDNHNLDLEASIESFDQSITETFSMFDDGAHNDGNLGDGVYGSYWPIPSGDRYFKVHIITSSIDSGYYNILRDIAYFTTVGPVVFDSCSIIQPFSGLYSLRLFLRNDGLTATATDITIDISTSDTVNVSKIVMPVQNGVDIASGQTIEIEKPFGVYMSGAADTIRFNLNIYSNGNHFWSDSLIIDLIPLSIKRDQMLPVIFSLSQNYPNPFNPSTNIEFTLPKSEFVTLKIFNILGEEISTLVNDKLQAGNHTYQYDGSSLASGIYLYRIEAGEYQQVRKMILIK